jgi:hypothetical protein
MAIDLIACRGTTWLVGAPASEGFSISPPIEGSEESPIVLQSLTVSDSVIHMPVNTLDGARILYIFGRAWGDISIGGLALLGQGGSGGALASVIDWFESNSAAVVDNEISVSVPGGSGYTFYALGLQISEPDTEINCFPFRVTGKIIGT